MKRYHWSLIAFLTLLLVLYLAAAWSPAMTDVAAWDRTGSSVDCDLASVGSHGSDWTPVLTALDPDKARHHPRKTEPLVQAEQFAILPEPVNGRELVDRVMTGQPQQAVMISGGHSQKKPRRVYERERIMLGYVVPVFHGA